MNATDSYTRTNLPPQMSTERTTNNQAQNQDSKVYFKISYKKLTINDILHNINDYMAQLSIKFSRIYHYTISLNILSSIMSNQKITPEQANNLNKQVPELATIIYLLLELNLNKHHIHDLLWNSYENLNNTIINIYKHHQLIISRFINNNDNYKQSYHIKKYVEPHINYEQNILNNNTPITNNSTSKMLTLNIIKLYNDQTTHRNKVLYLLNNPSTTPEIMIKILYDNTDIIKQLFKLLDLKSLKYIIPNNSDGIKLFTLFRNNISIINFLYTKFNTSQMKKLLTYHYPDKNITAQNITDQINYLNIFFDDKVHIEILFSLWELILKIDKKLLKSDLINMIINNSYSIVNTIIKLKNTYNLDNKSNLLSDVNACNYSEIYDKQPAIDLSSLSFDYPHFSRVSQSLSSLSYLSFDYPHFSPVPQSFSLEKEDKGDYTLNLNSDIEFGSNN